MPNEQKLLQGIGSLKDEIKKLKSRKKYGLVWEEKPEVVVELCKDKLPVLVEDNKREIATDKNKPVSILIEGDNYHALSVLNYTHQGKIDVIYIDPPYNTGNKDFIFNDKYVDLEDSYRHSKWLSFLAKRLVLAKNLLKNNGIVFISIDDNEQAQLKLLCSEIFGDRNVETYIWDVKDETEGGMPKTAKNTVRKEHEYLIVCFRDKSKTKFNKYSEFTYSNKESEWANPDNDHRGTWMSGNISRGEGNPGSKFFTITTPKGNKYSRNWSISKDEFEKLLKDNRIYFNKNENGVPRIKIFKNESREVIQSSIFRNLKSSFSGKNEIISILGKCDFNHPKPTTLLKRIISLSSNKNSNVLDFMAGTGTTGQAVLELNKEDNGNRKFILCTNNENKIAEKICYPRVKKVIEGYKDIKGSKVKGLGGNLKYYKTDFVEAKTTDSNKKKLVDKSTEMLCLKEDCFDGLDRTKTYSIFTNKQAKLLGIIYDDAGIEPFKREAKKIGKKFIVYVFSLDESAREEEFEDIADLVELKPIPAVILNVYKRIFK